jgi:hypothetical protein
MAEAEARSTWRVPSGMPPLQICCSHQAQSDAGLCLLACARGYDVFKHRATLI